MSVVDPKMSHRDYFAAAALSGVIEKMGLPLDEKNLDNVARRAYSVADAMIRVRGRLKKRRIEVIE